MFYSVFINTWGCARGQQTGYYIDSGTVLRNENNDSTLTSLHISSIQLNNSPTDLEANTFYRGMAVDRRTYDYIEGLEPPQTSGNPEGSVEYSIHYQFDLNDCRYRIAATLVYLPDEQENLDIGTEIAKAQTELLEIVDSIFDQGGVGATDGAPLSPSGSSSPALDELEKGVAAQFMGERGVWGEATFETLFNHDGVPKFVLSVSDKGYLVMDRDTGVVLESGQGPDPYARYLDAKKYYGGLGCYVVDTGEGPYDTVRGEAVESIPYLESADRLGDPAAVRQEAETGISALSVTQATPVNKKLEIEVVDIAKTSFGHNGGSTGSTCTAVACGLALNYLDRTVDDDIVSNDMEAEQMSTSSPNWNSSYYPHTNTLHNYLVDDCGMGPLTYADGALYGLNAYRLGNPLRAQTGIHAEWDFSFSLLANNWSMMVEEIDHNRPAMLTTFVQFDLSANYNVHSMVVYGYRITSSGAAEILVHRGWYGSGDEDGDESDGYEVAYVINGSATELWVPWDIAMYYYRFQVGAGWHTDSTGSQRYLGTDGEYYSGWQTIDGNVYYFRPTADSPSLGLQYSAVTGVQFIDETLLCTFDENGVLVGTGYNRAEVQAQIDEGYEWWLTHEH